MYKVFTLALSIVLLWGVAAWADDDGWDDWDRAWADFNGESYSHDVAERTLRASQPIYRNVMNEDGTMSREMIYYPDYPRHMETGTNPDQVYGPMWGVPGEAVGLSGYDPFYMMQYLGADPHDIPEEYRADVMRRRAELEMQRGIYHSENPQHGEAAPVQHQHSDDSGSVDEGDGLREDGDDWLD